MASFSAATNLKLDTFTEQQRTAHQRVRALIWKFHADLRADRTNRRRAAAG
jgi:hypothetical protein